MDFSRVFRPTKPATTTTIGVGGAGRHGAPAVLPRARGFARVAAAGEGVARRGGRHCHRRGQGQPGQGPQGYHDQFRIFGSIFRFWAFKNIDHRVGAGVAKRGSGNFFGHIFTIFKSKGKKSKKLFDRSFIRVFKKKFSIFGQSNRFSLINRLDHQK